MPGSSSTPGPWPAAAVLPLGLAVAVVYTVWDASSHTAEIDFPQQYGCAAINARFRGGTWGDWDAAFVVRIHPNKKTTKVSSVKLVAFGTGQSWPAKALRERRGRGVVASATTFALKESIDSIVLAADDRRFQIEALLNDQLLVSPPFVITNSKRLGASDLAVTPKAGTSFGRACEMGL